MIDVPKIVQTAPTQTAILRLAVAPNEMQRVMGPALREVMSAVKAQGATPTGPWFTHHFERQAGDFDFEICVPVSKPFTTTGRVTTGEWGATKVARTNYRGPYQGLSAAWEELDAWIAAEGHTPRSDLYERYVLGPESSSDSDQWQTELSRPLID